MNDYTIKENYSNPGKDFFAIHFQVTDLFPRYKDFMYGKCADFGCNNGGCTVHLVKHEAITELIAIDINKRALEELDKQKLSKIYCLHNNLLDLKVPNNTFDSAYSFHTLEHIYPDDLDKVVSEFYRALKPSAWILINVPLGKAYDNNQHVSFFQPIGLSDLFKRNGFYVLQSFEDLGNTITLLAQAQKENRQ
jgi:ubiquinone/menaquinone biosynthesis C-methylase UbiE